MLKLVLFTLLCLAVSIFGFSAWYRFKRESSAMAFVWLAIAAIMLVLAGYGAKAVLDKTFQETQQKIEALIGT